MMRPAGGRIIGAALHHQPSLSAEGGRSDTRLLPGRDATEPRRDLRAKWLLLTLHLELMDLLRQDLQQLLNMLELLRHDLHQVLETLDLMLEKLMELPELLRKNLQQLLGGLPESLRLDPERLSELGAGDLLKRLQIG
jgi:hypothetical protein